MFTKMDILLALLPASARPIVAKVLEHVPALRCGLDGHQALERDGQRQAVKVREDVHLYFCTRCGGAYWERP